MAWPFTTPVAPTPFFEGVVPIAPLEITNGTRYFLGADFFNNSIDTPRIVTIINVTTGRTLYRNQIQPLSMAPPYGPCFRPQVGNIEISVDGGTDVIGEVWGY